MRKKVLVVVLGVTFGLLMNPILSRADFYKWVDDQGNVHFTDQYPNIPEKYLPFAETRQTPIESSPPAVKEKPTLDLSAKSSEPAEQEASLVFRGVISGIDRNLRTIMVAGAVRTMVFPVPENTRITTDFGNPLLFTDLSTDMRVSVEHIQKGEDIQTLKIKTETMASGSPTEQKPGEKGGYEAPKYQGLKYEGTKYQGPKYQKPKYQGPKK